MNNAEAVVQAVNGTSREFPYWRVKVNPSDAIRVEDVEVWKVECQVTPIKPTLSWHRPNAQNYDPTVSLILSSGTILGRGVQVQPIMSSVETQTWKPSLNVWKLPCVTVEPSQLVGDQTQCDLQKNEVH